MKILITERQNKILNENVPAGLRRRINKEELKGLLDDNLAMMIIDNVFPCDWNDINDFVGDMCDMLVNDISDDYTYDSKEEIDSKSKDELFYFMVDTFADYLQNVYDEECD